jgi:methylenetetrahydrofolate dehydrogenase (NADP+)/methenyltetrahydrofolate cyclohydrolase
MTQILDGKLVRDKIAQELSEQISKLDPKPKLAIFQLGDVPESNTYISQKIKFGEKIGAIVEHLKLPESTSQDELIKKIQNLNSDSSVHGIIVQLPIPQNLDREAVIESVDPKKDVDGQTSRNIKLLIEGQDTFIPATTKGILTLLDHYSIDPAGKHVVVVGRSTLVGKPTALAFLNRDATITVCHKKTGNLAAVTKTADILVVAVGKINLITADHVTKNQVIIDVGINVVEGQKLEDEIPKRKLVGDVDFENVSKIVKAISPVPGGAGPMTVASLFQNLLQAYKNQYA